MYKFIGIVLVISFLTLNANTAQKEITITSIPSLKTFINEAISRGVIPKQLPVENTLFNAKFEDIDFNFRTLIKWKIDSKCPAHKDEIIDATMGKNHSIKCGFGDTIIVTGDGNDWIDDSWGSDIIYAGKGDDTIDAGANSDILIFEKGWGHDKVTLNGFEVIPTDIIGNDGTYHWKYSSFVVFGKGIQPDDLQWDGNTLREKKTGDSITFDGNRNFNVVFMDAPSKMLKPQPMITSNQKTKPIVLSEQKVESLEVKQNILYLCRGHYGIDIVDMKDINHPLLISHTDLPGRALQTKRYGNILYVAQSDTDMVDKKGWLSIIDVTNPSQPKLLNSLKYGGRVYDFLVEKNKLIIAESDRIDNKSVFHIVDISNPKKPKEIVSTLLKTHVQSIAVVNNWLWAACVHGCGAYGYDLNNLKKLQYTGYFTIDKNWIWEIQSNKKTTAVWVGYSNPVITFFADNNHIGKGLVSSIVKEEEMQSNNAFLLKDDYIFVAEGKNGIYIYNLSDITKPALKQKIRFDGQYIQNFAVSNDRVYAVDGNGAIHTKDIKELFLAKKERENCLSQDQLLTLLYKAVGENNGTRVNELIDQGAPFKMRGHTQNSPLESAAGLGNNEALKVLLDRGANPNFNHGKAIILAALYEKDGALRLLSKYGGDMKVKDKDDECTALHYIAQDGEVETAKFLISKGADPRAMCRGRQTPLSWAIFGKNQPMIDFLNSLHKTFH